MERLLLVRGGPGLSDRQQPQDATVGLLAKAERLSLPLDERAPISAAHLRYERTMAPKYDVHLACEVGVVLSGVVRRVHEGFEREVEPGQVWVCGAWEPHGWQGEGEGSHATSIVITFLLDLMWVDGIRDLPWPQLFLNHAPENRTIDLTAEESSVAQGLAREVLAECQGQQSYWLPAARLSLSKLLLLLVRRGRPAASGSETHAREYVRIMWVRDAVEKALPGQIRLSAACRAAGLSKSQFSAVFRGATGLTFEQFVQRIRIARAARDLLLSDTKISVVARAWGYTDQSHMHRVFKRFFRCTPGEYRRRFGPDEESLLSSR